MELAELLRETWARNSATILVEFLALFLVFLISGLVLGRFLRGLGRAPALARFATPIGIVHQNLRLLLLLGAVGGTLFVAGWNGWEWYRGADLYQTTRARIEAIPPGFWAQLALACGKIAGLAIATAIVLRLLRRALAFLCARAKAYEGIRANDEAVEAFFLALERLLQRGAWLGVLVIAGGWLGLSEGVQGGLAALLRIYLTIAAGLLVWRALDALIASLDALSKKYADKKNLLRYYDRLANLMPLFRRSVEYALYVCVATLVARQIEAIANLADWGPRLIGIIGIVFLSRVAVELVHLLLEEGLIQRPRLNEEQRKRRATIVPLVRSGLDYVVYFWAGILILKQLEVDPTPILAGAGILALAVGMGAQNLINDVVSGFFSLFENHYFVGDVVSINGIEGTVEAIELRVTRLRDPGGRHHIVRNGQISTLVNFSKQYVMAEVSVGIAYESDLDRALEVLRELGRTAAREIPDVLAPTDVLGLDAFGESELTLKTVTRVRPGRHNAVSRELRRRIKLAFDQSGIEIPYARRVVIFQNESDEAEQPPLRGGAGAA